MTARHIRGPGLDRLDEVRGREGLIGSDTRVVLVHGHRALIRDDEALCLGLEAVDDPTSLVLLGDRAGHRFAAAAVDEAQAATLEEATGGRFENLRWAGARLPDWQAGLLFYAAGLLAWHRVAAHCGVCGAPTRSARSGHQRVCTGGDCGQVHFPRSDPAIITLVRRGGRALLVHEPRWPERQFSTLAGFVEPGESLEQAIRREVSEETGLEVVGTEYFASQPWPFPHTLMVGFRTEVGPGDVVLGEELTDARWLTRAELRSAIEAGELVIPEPYALSRSLIEDWLGA